MKNKIFLALFLSFGLISFIYPTVKIEAAAPTFSRAVLQDYDEELGLFTIDVTGTDFFDFIDSETLGEATGESLTLMRFSELNPSHALINSETSLTLTFEGYNPITKTEGKTLTFGEGLIFDETGENFNEEVSLTGEDLIDNSRPILLEILPLDTGGFYDVFLFPVDDFFGIQIRFSEILNEASKEAIEEALTQGTISNLTFTWGLEEDVYCLRITSDEVTAFLEDITVEIFDLLNSSKITRIIDSSEGNGITAEALSDGTDNYSLPLCNFEEGCENGVYASVINFSGSILNIEMNEDAPIEGLSIIEQALSDKASAILTFVWESDYSTLKIFADEPATFTSDVWAYVFPNTDGPKEPRDEGEDEMFNIERVLLIDKDSAIPARRRSSSGSAPRNIIPILPQIPGGEEGCLPGYNFSPLTGQRCNATDPIIPNPENSQNQNQNQNQNQGNSYAFGQTLVKSGTRGEACRAWQTFLNHKSGANLMVDGICGPLTMKVARTWQTSVGLIADGLLGPASRGKALGQ